MRIFNVANNLQIGGFTPLHINSQGCKSSAVWNLEKIGNIKDQN